MSTELWRWSAEQTARGIRDGEISSTEAVTSALARLEATNAVSNAFGEVLENALDLAKTADAAVARGDRLGPLHGVPTAIKLNTDIEGLPTPDGVEAYRGNIATESAPVVVNLRAAGAIPIGRTNCPPFSFMWSSTSDGFGVTRNPWDASVTPGGSSGGAAAALATGVVSIAHGNDIAGSIRYPAAVCGVVGLRPTVGRVPLWHPAPGTGMLLAFQHFGVEGPMGRTVADVRLGLRAMQGGDVRDPVWIPAQDLPDAGPVRVAVVTDPGEHALAGRGLPQTDSAVRTAGDWLTAAGYEVEEVALQALGEAATLWWKLTYTELRAFGVFAEVERVGDAGIRAFMDYSDVAVVEAFGTVALEDYLATQARLSLLRRQISEFMDRYPLLLLPLSGEPPFPLGDDTQSAARVHELIRHQWPNTALPALGLPGLSLPVVPTSGAPLGIQLAGRAFHEDALLRAGEVIESRSKIITPIDPRKP
ncbi:amidase [Nocardia sp. CA-084685]|uniref:amidase n=1 Tax=Nocardia sp. CA-084685 TaxID=3239970 RepID=UPI003D95AF84